MYHYINVDGFKGISSQMDWGFRASTPPGVHPTGAYFTPLSPDTVDLCTKLLIPKRKTEYLFEFSGDAGLTAIDKGKGRGHHVFYSPTDYIVGRGRQRYKGPATDYNR